VSGSSAFGKGGLPNRMEVLPHCKRIKSTAYVPGAEEFICSGAHKADCMSGLGAERGSGQAFRPGQHCSTTLTYGTHQDPHEGKTNASLLDCPMSTPVVKARVKARSRRYFLYVFKSAGYAGAARYRLLPSARRSGPRSRGPSGT
jgi:hypothetical protein